MQIFITDKVHQVLIDGLRELGCDVNYDTTVDNDKLDTIIHEYDGLIINSKIIMNAHRIDRGTKLKFIGRLGSGLEIIDVPYAKKKKVNVFNSPEGNRNAVAEHEMGMLLSLLNNINIADQEVRSFSWQREKNRGSELSGKTAGIIGLGHTGGSFAEKLKSWNVTVIAYDKYKTKYPTKLKHVEKVTLDEVIKRSDIISLHLPLTTETEYLVDQNFINQCKKGVIISNTSRGKIINTLDLINGLENKQIGGACLDVFENEKPETYTENEKAMYHRLFTLQNVICTPHIAGWTHESLYLIAKVLLDKIKTKMF